MISITWVCMRARRPDLNIDEIRRRNRERNQEYRFRIRDQLQNLRADCPSRDEFEALKREVAELRAFQQQHNVTCVTSARASPSPSPSSPPHLDVHSSPLSEVHPQVSASTTPPSRSPSVHITRSTLKSGLFHHAPHLDVSPTTTHCDYQTGHNADNTSTDSTPSRNSSKPTPRTVRRNNAQAQPRKNGKFEPKNKKRKH